ncbi:MAG: ABC transporter ATP-binding protein [Spirochaetales bacterium]|nr:ABC transporter ATP-binding protein [Spirochaetales bacterium]
MQTCLEMRNICKTYSINGRTVNKNVDLTVRKGEIHALLGENGAGKTTLMNILYGIIHPDSGEIFINGKKVFIDSPLTANRSGIGMVHQHFRLIDDFTVAQNVVLGMEPRHGLFKFDNTKAEKDVLSVINKNGFKLEPNAKISDLSVGQMQQVEIVKMLYRKADLLILDEPTSVLTEHEIQNLFIRLKKLVKTGKTVIIITHKLKEVKRLSDRLTVLRSGKVVGVRNTADVDESEISRLMVGRTVALKPIKVETEIKEEALKLENVVLKKRRQERPILDNLSFKVFKGEILGIAAVAGNGLSELENLLGGMVRITSGRLLINGQDVTNEGAAVFRRAGLSYVPSDRLKRGSSIESSVRENIILTNHHRFVKKTGEIDSSAADEFSSKLIDNFNIDADPSTRTGTLSGGNIQKVILSRELEHIDGLVVFAEPTWGLDIASSEYIYKKIIEVKSEGAAVVIISSNIEEIINLSDRIIVMHSGEIVCETKNTEDIDAAVIGDYMLGLKNDFSKVTNER